MIGEELDSHVELIDETEAMVDRTDARLRQARKKLDYVGRKVKDNSKHYWNDDVVFCTKMNYKQNPYASLLS